MKTLFNKMFRLNSLSLSIILVLVLLGVYLAGIEYLHTIELKARDTRFKIRGVKQPGPEVVMATVDEKSLDELGRWPWPRSLIAQAIQNLNDDGAKVVGFDIGWLEPDHNTNMVFIQRLGQEIGRQGVRNRSITSFLERELELADNDRILAETIKRVKMPVVLGYFLRIAQDEAVAHITPEQVQEQIDRLRNSHYPYIKLTSPEVQLEGIHFIKAFMPVSNIRTLTDVAAASGYMNMFQDIDGTVRWLPLVIQLHDKYYIPLSLQTLRFALGNAPISVLASELGIEKVVVGDYEIPTDEQGRVLVNYRGPGRTFPHHSMVDIVQKRFEPGTFKDKIVLAGVTAVGVHDLRVTPFEMDTPGLEVHANIIDNILNHDFMFRPQWASLFDILIMIIYALALGFILPRLSAVLGLLFGVGLLGIGTGVNYLFFLKGVWLDFVYPTATIIFIYIGVTVFRYITEEREKRKIKGAFQTYVNPSVVNEMLKNPDRLKLGGDKKMLTVLFSDIAGFTTISEQMDPEALVQLLNKYLTVMTDLVFQNGGLLDKYIGDAVMAVYGAPLEDTHHSLNACRTALEMTEKLQELKQNWAASDPSTPVINMRIGINTGVMLVGNMGSETRFDYTVTGDAVNLASRLEGINKEYHTGIAIGETTYEQVKDVMFCRELDLVAVKGKTRPVRIYELLGENGRIPEEKIKLADSYARGLAAYRGRDFDKAQKLFNQVNGNFPDDGPTQLFLQRIAELKKNPPPRDWDGVFIMTTK